MEWVLRLITLLIAGLLIYIAGQDIRARIISHRSLLCLAVLIAVQLLTLRQPPNGLAAGVVLLAGFLLFCLNVMGGGDVKLLALLVLAIPSTQRLLDFIFLTTLIGGVIAIVGLIFFRREIRQKGVPYGVAISSSFIISEFILTTIH